MCRCNEEYYLQIDSHMRFRKNWDSYLIGVHNQCVDTINLANGREVVDQKRNIYTEPVLSST
jgi:hypothetical protein